MNPVARGSLTTGQILSFVGKPDFHGYKLPYPIHAIKGCSYEAQLSKVGDYAHAAFSIKATLTLEDAVDAKLFDQKIALEEDCDLLQEMDEEGEGYLFEGSSIDLDEVCLKIIASSLPIKVTRPGSQLPKGGKGFRVISEEEAAKEKAESYNPAFDKLKDFDPEKK
jgi:uncharacterized metal-binding protein YceD (DUF177 family)